MKRILLADGEENLRVLVHTTIEEPGYQILEASDGLEALAAAQAHQPDLVILDWMMPAMTGPEVAEKLRENEATSHIPIILLTAKGQQEDMAQGERLGVAAYLVKPFSPLQLLEAVNRLL
ncbi:MAG: response regulator [Acidobacteria bacterium]|nr:response regulator [Acidobacteriota bacterium]